ncbi:MAG: Na/Pi cotransporter family protein [Halanaerobiaceae bacterium]
MFRFLLGFSMFLIGLEFVKRALKDTAGQNIKGYLKNLDGHSFILLFAGILFTSILQSSSAVSIILIGLIEARLMNFKSALFVMMGANIGTTITVQLISFPVLAYYPYFFVTGFIFFIISYYKDAFLTTGKIFIAFGLVFFGLDLMTGFFNDPEIKKLFYFLLARYGDNKYLGILIGIISTSILQSSSAITGIVVRLGYNNIISLPGAVAIAAGSNIGTCITAFLASLNAGNNSKMLAKGHLTFNLLGILILLPLFDKFIKIVALTSTDLSHQIANAHTLFNVFTVIILLPLILYFHKSGKERSF